MKFVGGLVALIIVVTGVASATHTRVAIQSEPNCGCEDKPQLDVLAIVNGIKITRQDLSIESRTQVASLQQSVVEARENELDVQINTRLLEAEAKKRGLTAQKLLLLEVTSKVVEPTEADAQQFYNQNKSRIQKEFNEVKKDVIVYLRNERLTQRAKALAVALRAAAEVKVLVGSITTPTNEAERARVFATVNGANITSKDIEEGLLPAIFAVQEQVYALRKQALDVKINDLLLAAEAKKQGVTPAAVLETIKAKAVIPTEVQAHKFYNENKEKINREFSSVKDQIIQYLAQEEENKLNSSFADQLRRNASVQIFLTAPESPKFNIAIDDQPSKGNQNASVTLVEFTDFQCPSCAQHYPMLEQLMTEYGNRVKLVVRDYPLSQHENASKAAEAAEAARQQGKYWEYIGLLYRNQSALQVDKLKEYASMLNLDRAKFDAALDSGMFRENVQRDQVDGDKLGVNSTPTIFVNGRRVSDSSYEGLKAIIEGALKTAK